MISSFLIFLWTGLPVVVWIGNLLVGKQIHPAILYALTCVAGYVILLASVGAVDAELEAKMNSFDLNGDGSFSGAELTPAAERAMAEWSCDTGRAFAPFTGIPFTGVWYSFLFAVVFVGEWLFRICFIRKPTSKNLETAVSSSNLTPADDSNPYQSPRVRPAFGCKSHAESQSRRENVS